MSDLARITTCPNCGHQPFDTPFCPECGQRKLTERDFKVSALAGDFFNGFLNLDNAFLRTIKAVCTKPASYLQEYVNGARKKYISPIRIFLIANAWYFVFTAVNTFTTTLNTN